MGTCSIKITRRYDAAPDEVWAALRNLERWLAPPMGVAVAREQVGRLLELDWRPEGEPPSVVRLELRPEGARTVVVVEHAQIEATRGMSYMRSWMRVVERFEAAL